MKVRSSLISLVLAGCTAICPSPTSKIDSPPHLEEIQHYSSEELKKFIDFLNSFKEKTPEQIKEFLETTEYLADHKNPRTPKDKDGKPNCDHQFSTIQYFLSNFKGDCDERAHLTYAILLWQGYQPHLIELSTSKKVSPSTQSGPCQTIIEGIKTSMHRSVYFVDNNQHIILDTNYLVKATSLEEAVKKTRYTQSKILDLPPDIILFSGKNIEDYITEKSFYYQHLSKNH